MNGTIDILRPSHFFELKHSESNELGLKKAIFRNYSSQKGGEPTAGSCSFEFSQLVGADRCQRGEKRTIGQRIRVIKPRGWIFDR